MADTRDNTRNLTAPDASAGLFEMQQKYALSRVAPVNKITQSEIQRLYREHKIPRSVAMKMMNTELDQETAQAVVKHFYGGNKHGAVRVSIETNDGPKAYKIKNIYQVTRPPRSVSDYLSDDRMVGGINETALRRWNYRKNMGQPLQAGRDYTLGNQGEGRLIARAGIGEESMVIKARRDAEKAIDKVNRDRQQRGLGSLTDFQIREAHVKALDVTNKMLNRSMGSEVTGFEHFPEINMNRYAEILDQLPERQRSNFLRNLQKEIGDQELTDEQRRVFARERLAAFISEMPTRSRNNLMRRLMDYQTSDDDYMFIVDGKRRIMADTPEERRLRRERMRLNPQDEYEYNYRRLSMLEHIQREYGGYETYQKARAIHHQSDMTQEYLAARGIQQTEDGSYYRMIGDKRSDLVSTYDRHGRPVYAELESHTYGPGDVVDYTRNAAKISRGEETVPVTFLDEISVWDDTAKGSLYNSLDFDNMVLTGYGAQRADHINKMRLDIEKHKEVVDSLFESVKQAKKAKQYNQIELSELVQREFGLSGTKVSAAQLVTGLNQYLDAKPGITSLIRPVILDMGSSDGSRTFNALNRFIYDLNSEARYHPMIREYWDVWDQNRKETGRNLRELESFFGVLDGEDGGREELDSRSYMDRLYEEQSRLAKEADFSQRAMDIKQESMESFQRRNELATQKIVNNVVANMSDVSEDEIKNLESWVEGKMRLDEYGLLMRRKGDKVPVEIKEMTEEGMIVAERLRIDPSKITMRMQIEDNLQLLENVREATANHGRSVQDSIVDDYRTAIEKINRYSSIAIMGQDNEEEVARALRVINRDALANEFIGNQQIKIGVGKNSKDINAYLARVIANRAPWMISDRNDIDTVVQSANIAMYEALGEAKSIHLTDTAVLPTEAGRGYRGSYITGFDETFENLFIRNLHREYFRDVGDVSGPDGASVNLVNRIRQAIEQRDARDGRVINPAQQEQYMAAEISRLLNPATKAGKIITEEYPYMSDVFDPDFVSRALSDEMSVGGPPKTSLVEDMAIRSDLAMRGEDISAYDAIIDAQNNELFDETARGNDAWLQQRVDETYRELNDVFEARNRLAQGEATGSDRALLQQFFDEDDVDNLKYAKDIDVYKRLNTRLHLEFENNQRIVSNIMNALYRYGGIGSTQHDLNLETLGQLTGIHERKITSANDLRNVLLLREQAGEGAGFQFLHNFGSEKDPNLREIEVWLGRDGSLLQNKGDSKLDEHREILARVRGTNVTYLVSDADDKSNRIVFSAMSEAYDRGKEVRVGSVVDGSTPIVTTNAEFPIEVNPRYNVDRVNRSAGGGYMSSNSFATLRNIEALRYGLKEGVAFDFETTGLLADKKMVDAGLVLPTQLSAEYTRWDEVTGRLTHESAGNFFYDVGSHRLNDGSTVEDFVRNFSTDRSDWDLLSDIEKRQVMRDGEIGVLRNLAKYSGTDNVELMRQLTDFDHIPSNFNTYTRDLREHALRGIENLRTGMDGQGQVFTKLDDLTNAYRNFTNGRILIGHNLRDADIEWAAHFAKGGIDTTPEIIDTLHVSRMIDPRERYHGLDALRRRYPSLFEGGMGHLADVDTRDTLKFLSFGMDRLEELGLDSPEGLTSGHWLAKLNTRGGDYIQNDLYEVVSKPGDDLFNPNTGMYELRVQRMGAAADDIVDEVISAPSMQELNLTVGRNYKGFTSRQDADEFLENLTFDHARREVSEIRRTLGNMNKWTQRFEDGAGYDALSDSLDSALKNIEAAEAAGEAPSPYDIKVIENAGLMNREASMSDIQRRASGQIGDYLSSEDAAFQRQLLEEVENLKSVGAINRDEGAQLVTEFNQRIMRKAEQAGVTPARRAVPGFLDLGVVGEAGDFGILTNQRITAMANTYNQAERSVWEIADKFDPLVPKDIVEEAERRQQSLTHAMRFLRGSGVLPSDYVIDPAAPNMDDAVQALMDRLNTQGSDTVVDITRPLIVGEQADIMRGIYQETMDEVIGPRVAAISEDPVLYSAYENTRNMREQFRAQGINIPGLNVSMGSTYQGESIPMIQDVAGRGMSAYEMRAAIDAGADNADELWREIAIRASGKAGTYSDKVEAQEALGWIQRDSSGNILANTADNFIHPLGENAGMRYNEMEDDVLAGLRYGFNNPVRANEPAYMSQVKAHFSIFDNQRSEYLFESMAPSKVKMRELMARDGGLAREAINRISTEYVDVDDFERMGGAALPEGWISQRVTDATTATRKAMSTALEHVRSNSLGYAVGAGVLTAGLMIRQWTRGDNIRPDERPQHDQSPTTSGSFEKKQSQPWDGQLQTIEPTTLLAPTGQNKGYDIRVQARNPGHVSNDQIGNALNQVAQGAPINVHHQDDTATIGSEWIASKFSELLGSGFVN